MRFFHSPKKNQCYFSLAITIALTFFSQNAFALCSDTISETPLTITLLVISTNCQGLQIANGIGSLTNNATISATGTNVNPIANGGAVVFATTVQTFTNNGTITSLNNTGTPNTNGAALTNWGNTSNSIDSIVNNYLIKGRYDVGMGGLQIGILNYGSGDNTNFITSIINNTSGEITGSTGIDNGGIIGSIKNLGIIGDNLTAKGIFNSGSITTITNAGSIFASIQNATSIVTLNNLQNENNLAGALTYLGVLPTNYNIIINNTTSYGQLAAPSGTGNMAFGIYGGAVGFAPVTYTNSIGGNSQIAASIVANNTKYANVLQGVVGTLSGSTITGNESVFTILGATGSYGGYSYALAQNGSSALGNWDLIFGSLGPTAGDTQASIATQSRRLRSTFNSTMASSNFANMNTYDCNLFDKNNMCISAGGRYTNIDNPSSNNSAAVVVLGYKVSPSIRIGGFLDQSVNNNAPSGINVSNKNPMMGAFAVWNKNADGLGYQVKIANAYQDKDVTSTRDAFGETGEAGTGKTNLNTQSYVGELSYAFNYQDSTIVRPYFALRYTNIKQDAYTETGVDHPLSYAKLGDRSTTALMGVKLNHALTPRTNLTASLGIEQDINHKTDQLTASAVDISGLTSENFNNNIKRTRPVASAGAYYAVAKNQRLSGEVYYQQLPFQSTGSATAYVNYMIGF
jgi:hypothetical protein